MNVECPQCGDRLVVQLGHGRHDAYSVTCSSCNQVWMVFVEVKVKRITSVEEYARDPANVLAS